MTNQPVTHPDFVIDEYLEYLDDLRESGQTKMFGAGPWLTKTFGLDRHEARAVLTYGWRRSTSATRRKTDDRPS